jgi:hypothetical protein
MLWYYNDDLLDALSYYSHSIPQPARNPVGPSKNHIVQFMFIPPIIFIVRSMLVYLLQQSSLLLVAFSFLYF